MMMSHTIEQGEQDQIDEELIRHTFSHQGQKFLDDLNTRELDQSEKLPEAVDFADLSDEDLADDDPVAAPMHESEVVEPIWPSAQKLHRVRRDDIQGPAMIKTDGNAHELDDLFREASPSSELAFPQEDLPGTAVLSDSPDTPQLPRDPASVDIQSLGSFEDPLLSREQQIQQRMFAQSAANFENSGIPRPPETDEELLTSLWPKYKHDAVPRFLELISQKSGAWATKSMSKPPKPLPCMRLNVELAHDQGKSFKFAEREAMNLHEPYEHLDLPRKYGDGGPGDSSDELDLQSDYENDLTAGFNWQDLQILCQDWSNERSAKDLRIIRESDLEQDSRSFDGSLPVKRRKKEQLISNRPDSLPLDLWSLREPETTTAAIAQKVVLDLNDSRLLINEASRNTLNNPSSRHAKIDDSDQPVGIRHFDGKYNISNDEAYDLLKENHQHKVRGTLGSASTEHSLPAIRLQWPFYKTKLDKSEARSFHRPPLRTVQHELVTFDKPRHVKRKLLKGKHARAIYIKAEDLSLADNSTPLLLEYSEEHPTVLSNVGMGNRVINFYRRKTRDDTSRPKLEIGDLTVLLPEDKSPLTAFGHIDNGEIVPTLYNSMYRAPIFAQQPRSSDYLIIRSTTGVQGSRWTMRNIEYLRTVGQELPVVNVPGPHSRRVTTAAKNRLKMITYRMIRKAKSHRVGVAKITEHFRDSTDMQNRQKMKEFMQFDKDYKEWKMRPGDMIPDREMVRAMMKPDEVCLLESMQVGQQHLQDAGFSKEDDQSDDEAKEGQNIEQQLAPWYTSKNFNDAAAGKAMLRLHGDGDPSGRGEAFSLIKTSMKGGFKAMGESVAEKIESKRIKENNGHSYNVARQQQSYEESIRRIWDAQRHSLSMTADQDHSDIEDEESLIASETESSIPYGRPTLPATNASQGPDDEIRSQSTHVSLGSQIERVLVIVRKVKDRYGNEEVAEDVVRNPRIVRQYIKRRMAKEAESEPLTEFVPTGDAERDAMKERLLLKELERLQRNKDRRLAREKQKGGAFYGEIDESAVSPHLPGLVISRNNGTQRKCANCGQVGHIKTNKKLCPMLNGTMKPEEGFRDSAFTSNTLDT